VKKCWIVISKESFHFKTTFEIERERKREGSNIILLITFSVQNCPAVGGTWGQDSRLDRKGKKNEKIRMMKSLRRFTSLSSCFISFCLSISHSIYLSVFFSVEFWTSRVCSWRPITHPHRASPPPPNPLSMQTHVALKENKLQRCWERKKIKGTEREKDITMLCSKHYIAVVYICPSHPPSPFHLLVRTL
jgi:hypothetical protein